LTTVNEIKRSIPDLSQGERIQLFVDWFDSFRASPDLEQLEILDALRKSIDVLTTTGVTPVKISKIIVESVS
jgi:hypothetical protein